MIAWEPVTGEGRNGEKRTESARAGVLYKLAIAFPSCAGAILAIYALMVSRPWLLRVRSR